MGLGKRNDPKKPKACTKCHEVKPPRQFNKTRYGTLTSWCRACKNAARLKIWHDYKPTGTSTRISAEAIADYSDAG